MKIFIINDLNDILQKRVTHFSLDKGLHLGYGLANNNCEVYFLTTAPSIEYNLIHFINIKDANLKFLNTMNLIIIVRETEIPNILEDYPVLTNIILDKNRKSKIMVKSDSVQWIIDKQFRKYIASKFNIGSHIKFTVKWINIHFDYICVQTNEFKKDALSYKIDPKKLIVLNMAIPHLKVNYDQLENPYDTQHTYCVNNSASLSNGKALIPLYYNNNPDKINEFNKERKIIVYTGRIKTDGGKIFYIMRDIMEKINSINDDYELHIFPGSFIIPDYSEDIGNLKCSANNSNHLSLLREKIFENSKYIIIHSPYEHKDMYKYLHHAYCGIDFSDVRPKNSNSKAGHAKILEYCSVGLPIVCENNINNLFLVNNGKNGIILPYLASVEDYVNAIKNIGHMNIDREFCRIITYNNENCIKRARDLLELIKV